ncbi:hypothetical protein EVAR_69346_1 [Eumeta japonica]|uniref:Uncharacterized protein n=1 Tax=Eumeta variegata TaxID=151549 RepID=A0A4C1ZZL9_EUMVA|nr:hypothetical protein EVAR_69346_1 [Eumeta japonica]
MYIGWYGWSALVVEHTTDGCRVGCRGDVTFSRETRGDNSGQAFPTAPVVSRPAYKARPRCRLGSNTSATRCALC